MNIKISLVVLVLSFGLTSVGSQASTLPEPLQQVVDNMAKVQTLASTLDIKIIVQQTDGGPSAKNESTKFFAFRRPDQLRTDYLSPELPWTEVISGGKRFLRLADGSTRTEFYAQDPRMGRLCPAPFILFNLDQWWSALEFEPTGSDGKTRMFTGRLKQASGGFAPVQYKVVVDTQQRMLIKVEQFSPDGRSVEEWRFDGVRTVKAVAFPTRITQVTKGLMNEVTTIWSFHHLRLNEEASSNLFLFR